MIAGLALRLGLVGVAVAAVVAGWLYVAHLRGEVARLGEDLTTAEHAAKTNAEAVVILRQDAERKLAALTEERDAAVQRAAHVVVIKERIHRAPQSDDGPVAPVLCTALSGLWGDTPAPGSACRAAGGSAQPAGLPPASGATGR